MGRPSDSSSDADETLELGVHGRAGVPQPREHPLEADAAGAPLAVEERLEGRRARIDAEADEVELAVGQVRRVGDGGVDLDAGEQLEARPGASEPRARPARGTPRACRDR